MNKISVLFLCIHNSARSQMAEAFLKQIDGDLFEVESAGLEPGKLNRLAVHVMLEARLDISGNATKDVFEFHKQGKTFNYVITVCDPEASDRCPVFPGLHKKINWAFDDPSSFSGPEEERLERTRLVRDQIREAVQRFAHETRASLPAV